MNVLSARAAGMSLPNIPAAAVHIGIRPEDISLSEPGRGHLDGRIDVVERLGSDTFAYVALEDGSLITVRAPRDSAAAVGQPIGIQFQPDRIHAFDQSGTSLTI